MHMHDEAFSPELSDYLVKKMNKICGLSLQSPLFLSAPDVAAKVKRNTGKETKESGRLFE